MFNSRTSISTASDEHLASLVSQGHKKAWEQLYDRYFDVLFRFSFGYLKSEDKAEDVVQDVFIGLPTSIQKFNTNKRFKTWIFTLAANRCKNMLRNNENRNRLANNMSTQTVYQEQHDKKIDLQVLKSEIQQLIATCSAKEQELYHLRFEMDMSVNEMAELMNLPIGSIKSGLFYLLKKIRTPLNKISNEYR